MLGLSGSCATAGRASIKRNRFSMLTSGVVTDTSTTDLSCAAGTSASQVGPNSAPHRHRCARSRMKTRRLTGFLTLAPYCTPLVDASARRAPCCLAAVPPCHPVAVGRGPPTEEDRTGGGQAGSLRWAPSVNRGVGSRPAPLPVPITATFTSIGSCAEDAAAQTPCGELTKDSLWRPPWSRMGNYWRRFLRHPPPCPVIPTSDYSSRHPLR